MESRELSSGEKVVRLLADPSWIQRRVETVTMRADGETRRQVSFDFALPPELHLQPWEFDAGRAIRKDSSRVVVPLGFMRKGTLVDLDVADETGKAVPVLSIGQNGRIVLEAMNYLLRVLGGSREHSAAVDQVVYSRVDSHEAVQEVEKARRAAFGEIARHSMKEDAQESSDCLAIDSGVQALVAWLRTLLEGPSRPELAMLASLLATMSENYVFAVEIEVEDPGARTLLKVSYASRVKALRRSLEVFRNSEVWQLGIATASASSTHLEIETTPGVQIGEIRVVRGAGVGANPFAHAPAVAAHRVHVFTNRKASVAAAFTRLRVTVVPVREGPVSYSLFAAVANFIAQVLMIIFGDQIVRRAYSVGPVALSEIAERLGPLRDTTAVTMVSLVLSLAAAVLVIVQFHDVERRVSFVARAIILASALLFGLALMSLTFHAWTPPAVDAAGACVRKVCTLVSVGLVAWASRIWFRTSPQRVEQKLREHFGELVDDPLVEDARAPGLAATESALFEGLSIGAMRTLESHFQGGSNR